MTRSTQPQIDACPQRRHHVKDEPEGYIAWHEWAQKKARTHYAVRCDGCGLFVVWRPRRKRA